MWEQLCAGNCTAQNLCSLFHGMKFPLRASHSVFLPSAGLQAVDALTSTPFLVPPCQPAVPLGSVPSSLLGPAGFCIGRSGEVSEDVTPTPGSWPRAKSAFNTKGWMQWDNQQSPSTIWELCPLAGMSQYGCREGRNGTRLLKQLLCAVSVFIMGRIPRPAVHRVLPHLC